MQGRVARPVRATLDSTVHVLRSRHSLSLDYPARQFFAPRVNLFSFLFDIFFSQLSSLLYSRYFIFTCSFFALSLINGHPASTVHYSSHLNCYFLKLKWRRLFIRPTISRPVSFYVPSDNVNFSRIFSCNVCIIYTSTTCVVRIVNLYMYGTIIWVRNRSFIDRCVILMILIIIVCKFTATLSTKHFKIAYKSKRMITWIWQISAGII